MANYYATARSNYFAVKDETAFREWAALLGLTILEPTHRDKAADGIPRYGITPGDGDDSGWPTLQYNEETNDCDDIDVPGQLSAHLADEEVAILMEVGNEKLRYVSGSAVAVNNQGKSVLLNLGTILRVYVDCAARLYGDPREADLIKIHLHSRKLTFHYYRNFETTPLPELLTRIKIDLRRLFVTVIDHTNGREHQLLFFKERFLPKDHPDRPKMDRFSAKLRKLGLREETIGYGPSKEKWEEWNRVRQEN